MSPEEATPLVSGGGWDDNLEDPDLSDLNGESRRRAAEEKRQQRRLQRGVSDPCGVRREKTAKLAATRTEM